MTRASVDVSLCQATGRCVLKAPELFGIGDDGKVRLIDAGDLNGAKADELHVAVISCPEHAIGSVDGVESPER